MKDEKRLLKWSFVIVPVVAAALAIYPPSRKLKAGIDLAGGSSLLFEIDTSGLESAQQSGLANAVMQVLKQRVDPNGQLNLIWRPIGNNRLEIQMPRPPREALERRKAYEAARDELQALNVSRLDIEAMVNASEEMQTAKRDELAQGIAVRGELLDTLIEAHDRRVAAREADDFDAMEAAQAAYQDAVEAVLETSLDLGRLADVLALTNMSERERELQRLRDEHTAGPYASALEDVITAYDAWAKDKGALEDPSDLKRRIRGAGVLEFVIMAERDPAAPNRTAHADQYLQEPIGRYSEQLQKRGPRVRPGDNYRWVEVADIVAFLTSYDSIEAVERSQPTERVIYEKYAGKWYILVHAEKKFGLLRDSAQKWKLVTAFADVDGQSGRPAVGFVLDSRGGRLFADLTADNLQRPMAIVLDDVAQSFANIQSMIRERGQITSSSYTQEKVGNLVSTLRAGSLPARLIETPIMEQTIGPQLGEHNRRMGMRAAMIGGIAVALFMIVYYRFAGIVANVALAMNLLFVLGIMAGMQATFTLPGIAALILTVGMAVDANVLIFERIREERDRGIGMRKSLRVGYERAFSTIVDANVTTLITCVVLGYVGTEEVKGFAMVLGFGIATSMFTSLFVTRLIFTSLLDRGWLKNLSMARLFQRPDFDWIALRRVFWPVSGAVVVLGVAFITVLSETDREALYDIEFLGGTSVQFDLKHGESLSDEDARRMVTDRASGSGSAVAWLRDTAATAIEAASVAKGAAGGTFAITSDVLTAEQIEATTRSVFEPDVERGGFVRTGHTLTIETKALSEFDVERVKSGLRQASSDAARAAGRLASARIQTVRALDAEEDAPPSFEVTTVETNKELVQAAILAVMGPRLAVERAVSFDVVTDAQLAPTGLWPIEEDARQLADVIEEPDAQFDIRDFKGGLAIMLDAVSPPMSVASFEKRMREIRLQPEFSRFDARPFRVIGLTSAGTDDGEEVFSKIAYVVVDENLPYYDDPAAWEDVLAKPELAQVSEALGTEKSLRKVIQFAPQVASQTQNQAVIAVVMALAAIVAYIWIRFGQMQFGLAAIVALVHDVVITLGLVAGAHFVYSSVIGRAMLLSDFKIDLPMVAAFLTIIGYSLNDTIVVFDRIRENRGKLKKLTPAIMNISINQCLSRTVLTSATTFIAVFIMYVFGGAGIHGFSFALMSGVIVGTYSSVGIAAPLLHRPKVLHTIVYVLITLTLFGGFSLMVGAADSRQMLITGAGVALLAALAWAINLEFRSPRGRQVTAAGA